MLRPVVCAAVLSTVWNTMALAQHPLRGSVTDVETGAAIGAARITVRGTAIRVFTASDGRFSMTVPDSALTLDVRRLGYQAATVPVAAGQSEVNIALKVTAIELTEQVVTGQATTIARRNLANDVSSVSAEDLNRTHSQTIENSLQGKVPGAVITANSGAPGGGLQVQMRGITSIFGNSAPLYVVDGVAVSNTVIENGLNAASNAAAGTGVGLNSSSQDNGVNRIADLNPEDIETVDFLKGPSAAAIYGSSAANGVIIITTKRGAPGPARFSVTQRVGTHALSHKIGERRFTLAQAIAYDTAPASVPGGGHNISPAATTAMYQASGGFQDFEQQIFGDKSLSYETDISVSGGSEKTQYFVSGLEQHDNGIMYGTGYDKQGLRLNLTQSVGSKLELKANVNFVHTLTRRGFTNNDNVNVTPYFIIANTPSFFSFQPVNGVYPANPFLPPGTNPIQTLAQFSLPEDVFRFIGSLDATYTFLTTPTQSVRATLNAGLDAFTMKANLYAPATLIWQQATGLPGLATDLTGTEAQSPVALTVTHAYTPSAGTFTATTSAGVRQGFDNLRTNNVVTQNLLANQQNVNLGTAVSVYENRQRVRTLALFGQEEVLLLDQRLYLSAGILGQRSTNNADISHFFAYPKAGASYRWPALGPFQELKLRAAFGETGNEPLYAQKFTSLVGVTYTGQLAVNLQGNLADPTLHPEREREIEAGVDATLLDSRVALSVTGYQKNNTDLLLQSALALTTGYFTHTFNGGEIRNRGIEAAVSGFPVRTKDVGWLARVTFAKNVGKVLSLPASVAPGCPSAPTCGFLTPNFFAYAFGGGFIQVGHSPSQILGYGLVNGAYKLVPLGDYQPDFTVGLSHEVTFRNFRLNGLLEWRKGNSVVNLTQVFYDGAAVAPDPAASAQRFAVVNAGGSPYIEDGSFLKLREVTLSYQVPDKIVRSLFGGNVSGVRAELSGRNLVTWTPYPGLDPEVSNFGNQSIREAQDVTPYPPSRSFFFTLAVDF